MPAPFPTTPRVRSDAFDADRILLFGGSDRTLDLLRLAAIRSDTVTLISAGAPSPAVKRSADAFAIAMRDHERTDDMASAAAVLVAIGEVGAENDIVRRARTAGTPVHVADRPLVSDFTLLELLERRASTVKRHPARFVAAPASLLDVGGALGIER